MVDMWTPEQRSEVMRRIRSSGNAATELKLISIFKQYGVKGWRRNVELKGKPDFVFRRERLVVFVDGCFWHKCPQCFRRPRSNQAYWDAKISRNTARDIAVAQQLRAKGWAVVRIWQHELKNSAVIAQRLKAKLKRRTLKFSQ